MTLFSSCLGMAVTWMLHRCLQQSHIVRVAAATHQKKAEPSLLRDAWVTLDEPWVKQASHSGMHRALTPKPEYARTHRQGMILFLLKRDL